MYPSALRDPETLIDVAWAGAERELLLSVAYDAYERTTGDDLHDDNVLGVSVASPASDGWLEEF